MEEFLPDDLNFLSEVVDYLIFQDSRCEGSGASGEFQTAAFENGKGSQHMSM